MVEYDRQSAFNSFQVCGISRLFKVTRRYKGPVYSTLHVPSRDGSCEHISLFHFQLHRSKNFDLCSCFCIYQIRCQRNGGIRPAIGLEFRFWYPVFRVCRRFTSLSKGPVYSTLRLPSRDECRNNMTRFISNCTGPNFRNKSRIKNMKPNPMIFITPR